MYKFEKARTFAVVMAILFYVIAKLGCIGITIGLGDWGAWIPAMPFPICVSIFMTLSNILEGENVGWQLAIQISCLGLTWLSILAAYICHRLSKAEYKWK